MTDLEKIYLVEHYWELDRYISENIYELEHFDTDNYFTEDWLSALGIGAAAVAGLTGLFFLIKYIWGLFKKGESSEGTGSSSSNNNSLGDDKTEDKLLNNIKSKVEENKEKVQENEEKSKVKENEEKSKVEENDLKLKNQLGVIDNSIRNEKITNDHLQKGLFNYKKILELLNIETKPIAFSVFITNQFNSIYNIIIQIINSLSNDLTSINLTPINTIILNIRNILILYLVYYLKFKTTFNINSLSINELNENFLNQIKILKNITLNNDYNSEYYYELPLYVVNNTNINNIQINIKDELFIESLINKSLINNENDISKLQNKLKDKNINSAIIDQLKYTLEFFTSVFILKKNIEFFKELNKQNLDILNKYYSDILAKEGTDEIKPKKEEVKEEQKSKVEENKEKVQEDKESEELVKQLSEKKDKIEQLPKQKPKEVKKENNGKKVNRTKNKKNK